MKTGVLLPIGKAVWGARETGAGDPRELIKFAIRAEELGFDSIFVNDSLINARIEALAMLAAVAPMTKHVTLGTAALLPFLRRPVQTAAALSSIDLLSRGRLVVAVGAGFPGRLGQPLYTLSDTPWARRFKRLDETVQLWRQLWASEQVSEFHGELVQYTDIPPVAAPCQPGGPPIWLGGAAPGALARTGRLYDGWLPYPPDPADYATGLATVHKAAADAGRSADDITPALFVTVRIDDSAAAAHQVLRDFATTTYGMPLEQLAQIQALVTGTSSDVAAGLAGYAAAGARHIVVRLAALNLTDQYEQLERLAPLLTHPTP
jgi:alkanesulfonate monooxygenase SsuD/methylene tetrahydromethanopterin reductase-like flavin-dependent oxidoreductase (luciferase family)